MKKCLVYLFLSFMSVIFVGCAEQTKVVRLTEKQILEHETVLDRARACYYKGDYKQAIDIVSPLCTDLTTSLPLYQCEIGLYYLANGEKAKAKENLLNAYKSIECFFDPSTEKRAVSLWGAESDKVFKGEPYEQATLCLLLGALFLEEGDVDNALACFKSGQIADSDSSDERYKCDFGLLQYFEAYCYKLRGEMDDFERLRDISVNSFVKNHPERVAEEVSIISQIVGADNSELTVEEREKMSQKARNELLQVERSIREKYSSYYTSLFEPYNTIVLVWSGKSPKMVRTGAYQSQRVAIQVVNPNYHYEMTYGDKECHDVIRGFANISYQAITRGERLMDEVLEGQANFKEGSANAGNTFFELAENSGSYLQLGFLAAGLIAHSISGSVDSKADLRWWKTLPNEIGVVPLMATPGESTISVDCYNNMLRKCREIKKTIFSNGKPFEFHLVVIPNQS